MLSDFASPSFRSWWVPWSLLMVMTVIRPHSRPCVDRGRREWAWCTVDDALRMTLLLADDGLPVSFFVRTVNTSSTLTSKGMVERCSPLEQSSHVAAHPVSYQGMDELSRSRTWVSF